MNLFALFLAIVGTLSVEAFSAPNAAAAASRGAPTSDAPIPITVLAGFLGSGKTTVLQHLLENNEGLKIAVIVNDVASVNIDSKLVGKENKAAGMVELQNGCACCSRSEELLSSVAELVILSDMRGNDEKFDHIVIELSGVADPRSIRNKFQEAMVYRMPIMDRVSLDTMVTLVDCTTFLDHLKSAKVATVDEAPELFYRDKQEIEDDRAWQDDLPVGLLEALQAGEKSAASSVPDLLVSQTEVSDIVLLSKVDLVDDETKLRSIEGIVGALNPHADVIRAVKGDVPLQEILAVAKGMGCVESGVLDDHRDAVQAVEVLAHDPDCNDPDCTHESHDHSHDHACDEPARTNESHSDNHDYARADPDCTNESHSHSHDHACSDPECTDESHSHSHDHACSDPDCTDSSHSGIHDQAEEYAGIGSFVYRARRPFHPSRLTAFLSHLPVKRGVPEDVDKSLIDVSSEAKECLDCVVRSKGFTWSADSDETACYWSHAGASIELTKMGTWWAAMPREEWPKEAVEAILEDFDDKEHEEGSTSSVGDRRQEVVFIGPTLADGAKQQTIRSILDQCLLSDDEWQTYHSKRGDEEALSKAFPSQMIVRLVSF